MSCNVYGEVFFFFDVPFLMDSDGGGSVEQQCTRSCIFRIRVRCDDVSFPAPSEALKLGKLFLKIVRLLQRSFLHALDSLKCILYGVGYMYYALYD